MNTIYNAVVLILLLVILVLVSVAYTIRENPGLELLDIDIEGRGGPTEEVVAAIKVSKEGVDMRDCILDLMVDDESATLEYCENYNDELVNTRRSVSVSAQDYLRLGSPITVNPLEFLSIDSDGVNDSVFICHEANSCPSSYAGKYLAFNLSSREKLVFIPLEGVDLSHGSQVLDMDYLFGPNLEVGISAKGKTIMPYTIGLGDESVTVYSAPVELVADINADGKKDYAGLYDKIVIIPSGARVSHAYSADSAATEFGKVTSAGNELVISPAAPDTGCYDADSIAGQGISPVFNEGEVIRIRANTPQTMLEDSSLGFRMICHEEVLVSYSGQQIN